MGEAVQIVSDQAVIFVDACFAEHMQRHNGKSEETDLEVNSVWAPGVLDRVKASSNHHCIAAQPKHSQKLPCAPPLLMSLLAWQQGQCSSCVL